MKTKEIRIAIPKNFSWDECLWYLDRNYNDCLFHISNRSITKLVPVNGKQLLLQVTGTNGELIISCLNEKLSATDVHEVRDHITEWLDLDRDIKPFYKLLKANDQLAFMAKAYAGLRLPGIPDMHEALCWCIIGQQINLTFAHTLKRRLTEQYGASVSHEGQIHYAFPSPEILAGLTVDELKLLQFSTRKAEYVIGVSQLMAEGTLSKEKLLQLGTYEERVASLVKVRGIGAWTANYVLMKSLRMMQSITYGDAGMNKALQNLAGFGKNPSAQQVDEYFKPFKGWEAYLVFYLWRTLS